jgi:hypothetical protein
MNNNPLNNSVSVPVAVPVVTYSNASTDKARISCLKISSYMSAAKCQENLKDQEDLAKQ